MSRNVSAGLLLSLVLIFGGHLGLTSASIKELNACFKKYVPMFNNFTLCPDYDKALECLNKVNPKDDSDIMFKQNNINYLTREKDESCRAFTSRGTRMKVEFHKCEGMFREFLAYNDPAVCEDVQEHRMCLQDLEAKCPHNRRVAFMLHEVQEIINKCNIGHYDGKCAPYNVESCIVPAFVFSEGLCKESEIPTAKLCLEALRKDCKPSQVEVYELMLKRLLKCPIKD